MNDRSRMTLYTLTALACVVWIWQSVREAMQDGSLASASTIIFLVCIGVAAVYCAGNALVLWWRQGNDEDNADASTNADDNGNDDDNAGNSNANDTHNDVDDGDGRDTNATTNTHVTDTANAIESKGSQQ